MICEANHSAAWRDPLLLDECQATAAAVPPSSLSLLFRAKKIIRMANDLHSRGIWSLFARDRLSPTARTGR